MIIGKKWCFWNQCLRMYLVLTVLTGNMCFKLIFNYFRDKWSLMIPSRDVLMILITLDNLVKISTDSNQYWGENISAAPTLDNPRNQVTHCSSATSLTTSPLHSLLAITNWTKFIATNNYSDHLDIYPKEQAWTTGALVSEKELIDIHIKFKSYPYADAVSTILLRSNSDSTTSPIMSEYEPQKLVTHD